MRRLWFAIVCFFRVLLGKPLPPQLLRAPAPAPAPVPASGAPALARSRDDAAVTLLSLLQREGRLVDFLLEDIDGYDDAQVGAAVRDVHRGCRRVLEEHFVLKPVMKGKEEGSEVTVEKGFDAAAIRLTGAVTGAPPFSGKLRHPGWRVEKTTLPPPTDGIVAPAEVEL